MDDWEKAWRDRRNKIEDRVVRDMEQMLMKAQEILAESDPAKPSPEAVQMACAMLSTFYSVLNTDEITNEMGSR